jgi:hypothetical protein
MKTLIILLLALVAVTGNGFAQNLIAVQNAGTPSFFLKIAEAIESALDGDTIYLPGGSFGDCTINKRIHMVGVGHDPDSTEATLITFIPYVLFDNGSSGSTLTGIRTTGLSVGNSSDDEIKNLIISRCHISNCDVGTKCSNISFIQNIINTISGNGIAHDISFSNNKIKSLQSFEYCSFRNNIILSAGCITLSVFENNFLMPYYSCSISSNILNNNISYSSFNITTQNVGANNLFIQDGGSIFVKEDSDFEYGNDYHLQSDCKGKNAGKDGTDMGIYGGAFPWKEGSIPSNPHFQRIQISPTTGVNGNLNVNIKVAAQER